MALTYQNTSKREWARIAYNLAMQLSEDNEERAMQRLNRERKIVKLQLWRE